MGRAVHEPFLLRHISDLCVRREKVLDVALLGPNTTECIGTVERPDTLRAFFLILVYTAVFVAAALRIIQRRDVAGARGD